MSELFKIHLFGGFRLERQDGSLVNVPLRKGEALIAFLAASSGGIASRERLATLLWGESEQHRARQSLRQVLFALTREFSGDERPLLRMENQLVALNSDAIWVDVGAFEKLVERGEESDLARALRLYAGDFLADLSIDAPGFEEWLTSLRAQYQDMAMKAAEKLLELQETRNETGAAIDTALWALRLDPYREDLHRRLMKLYVAKGMRSSALTQYRACAALLARELDVQPDPETTAVYRAILEQEPPQQSAPGKRPADSGSSALEPVVPGEAPDISEASGDGRILIGRDDALEVLGVAMADARDGSGACLTVVGEAGIGRTALVERFGRALVGAGTAVVTLRARSGAGAFDWALWAELLNEADLAAPAGGAESLSAGARHEIALFKASGEAADPLRLRDAAVELIRLRCARAPLCLILEDLHRADAESLRLFESVVRRLRNEPLFVVATFRSDAGAPRSGVAEIQTRLEDEGLTKRLRLEPLSREDCERLVAVVAGELWPEQRRARVPAVDPGQIWATAHGNPRQLIDCLRAAALTKGAGGDAERPVWALSADELGERLARLDPAARRVAAVAAMFGPRSACALVLRAAGLADESGAGAVEALVEAGILAAEGEDLVFARSLARRVVLDGLLMPRRRALHAESARAIEAWDSDVDDPLSRSLALARHWLRAGDTHKAALWAWRATGIELDRGADRAARRSLQRVVALAGPQTSDDPAQAVRLEARIALAEIAERAGEFEVAFGALRRLEARFGQIDRPRYRALVLLALSRLEALEGRQEPAHDYARRGLAEARSDGGETLWYPFESLLERLHLVSGAYEATIERLGGRMQRSRRHGLRRQEADTAATLGVLCGLQGNFESAEAACRTAVYAAEAIADERRVAACLQAWAAVRAWQGRYEDALETLERAELLAESRGDLLRLYALGGVRGFAQAGAKHFAEAQASFDAALALGRELGAESYRPLFMAWLAEARFEAGQGETALLSAREAFRLAAEANRPWPRSIALRTLARVLAHPEVGDLSGALKAARSALAEQDGLGLSFEIARTQIAYAKILRASGELERSSRAYAQASVLFQKMRMTGEYDSAKTLAEALRPTGA